MQTGSTIRSGSGRDRWHDGRDEDHAERVGQENRDVSGDSIWTIEKHRQHASIRTVGDPGCAEKSRILMESKKGETK